MNTLGSLGDFERYQPRSIHRRMQVECPFALSIQGFLYISSIGKIDRVLRLEIKTAVTWSIRRYWEQHVSHCIEQGNDFTDRVVTSASYPFLGIRVRDNVRRVHVVEHDLIGWEQDSHESDGWASILVGVDPFERAVTRWVSLGWA